MRQEKNSINARETKIKQNNHINEDEYSAFMV
jgi:hypothetical protein